MPKLKEKTGQAIDAVKRTVRVRGAILGAIFGGILIALFLWLGPKWHVSSYRKNVIDKHYWSLTPNERTQLDREMLKAENDARVTLAQILGGLGLLVGLYFTWRNLRVTEDGKITDRYSKAIELLGSDKMDVRLGGIYALERIAKDSEKDHWTVMEALTAFVREHSLVKTKQTAQQGEPFKSEEEKKIATDIQAILTVIGRRKWIEQEKRKGQGLDLCEASLFEAELRGADLRGASLFWADLGGASLFEANLSGANLSGANLSGANLSGASLQVAGLCEVNLSGASLIGANLSWARLRGANLSGASLSGANLSGANLIGANLSGASLIGANLSGANLIGANLSEAHLGGADLSGAHLSGSYVEELDIEGIVIGRDVFGEARCLTWEQVQNAIIDENTQLPPDLEAKRKDAQKQK